MRLKALLLGSATAIAMAGGAQAADLSVAEPVDYVKVCDAFGTGYWYIPGTDTCLKIWGFVEFKGSYDQYNNDYYEEHYDFYTGAYLNFSAKSMTDWGPLEGFLAFYANQGGVYFDEGYVSLGPLLAGYTHSGFNQQYPWVLDDSSGAGYFQPEEKTSLIRLTWAVNGFGILLEADEPNYELDYYDYGSSMPDLIAAITASTAMLDGKIAFVWSDYSDGWAVSAGVVLKLDSLAPGDKLLLKAAYGTAEYYVLGRSGYPGSSDPHAYRQMGNPAWSAMANFVHYFAPNFNMSALVNYASWEHYREHTAWQAAFNIGYSPVPNLWITPEVRWWSDVTNAGGDSSNWRFTVRARRTFF